MKSFMKQSNRSNNARRGSVLIEYVMLNLLILLPLVIAIPGTDKPNFNPLNDQTESMGLLAYAMSNWYQKVVDGICLPIP